MTQRAARNAPAAKVSRLEARCVSSSRSPGPAKMTVWSPTISPARIDCVETGRSGLTRFGQNFHEPLRRPARRILLCPMMHLDNVDVELAA